MSNTSGRTLSIPIGHAPVAGDPPGLNGVVQSRHGERGIQGLVPVLGDLCARRLNLAQFVRAARKELGLLPVPIPLIAETGMGHALWGSLELSVVPVVAGVRGQLPLLDCAATGPGQTAALVVAGAAPLLSGSRARGDRLG